MTCLNDGVYRHTHKRISNKDVSEDEIDEYYSLSSKKGREKQYQLDTIKICIKISINKKHTIKKKQYQKSQQEEHH